MAKGDEFTTKFKVDVSDLKKGISEANQQMKLANAQFKASTAGMDDWANTSDGLIAKLHQLDSVLSAQKTKLSAYQTELQRNQQAYEQNGKRIQELKAKLAELADQGISKTSAEYKKYEAQLASAEKEQEKNKSSIDRLNVEILKEQANIGSTEKEIGKYEKSLDDLVNGNEDAAKSGKKVDDSLEEIGDESERTEKKLDSLASLLAEGLKKGAVAFGAAVAGAVSGLTAATVSAGKYADEILTLSKTTGMSTDALQAYNYAAELVDVSMETLAGSLKKNTKSMASAADGSKAYADAYKALGISVVDANGELRNSEEVYWETIDALGQIENETERDAMAMQIFGKSATELNPLIEAGSDAIKGYTEEAEAMGAVMSSDQLNDLGAFDDAMQRIKSGAEAAKNALGTVLLPQLQELADEGSKLIGEFTNGIRDANGDWSKIAETIGNSVGSIAESILNKAPAIVEVAVSIVKNLGSAILRSAPILINSVKELLPQVLRTFVSFLPEILIVGSDLVVSLLDGIGDMWPELIDGILSAVPLIISSFANDAFPKIVTAVCDLLPVLVSSAAQVLIEQTPVLLKSAIDLFMALVRAIPPVIKSLIVALGSILSAIGSALITPAKEKFSKLWSDIKDIFGKVGFWFGEKFGEAWDNIKTSFGKFGQFFADLWDNVKTKFSELGTKIGDAISGAVKSGINGIISRIENIINNAINLINGAIKLINLIPGVSIGSLNRVSLPRLEKGGILRKGQIGLLEGTGAEAVVPLDQNKKWISAVANDMLSKLNGSTVNNIKNNSYNFTQVINAPKAPSRIELYRQTRNLLAYAKEGV